MLKRAGFCLCVTGNYNKVKINPLDYACVTFMGYLPESIYYSKLFSCSVVLDLTENDNCLVCGAYEAMAAEKPLVTSNTCRLKRYLKKGTIFTDHTIMDIFSPVKLAYDNRVQLTNEIAEWKRWAIERQRQIAASIFDVIGDLRNV